MLLEVDKARLSRIDKCIPDRATRDDLESLSHCGLAGWPPEEVGFPSGTGRGAGINKP